MEKWKIIALVVGCITSVLLIAAYFLTVSRHRNREKDRISQACATIKNETIFMMIVSYNDPFATAETIADLFEKAYCPLRLYVGVFELFTPGSTANVLDEYELQTKFSKSPFCLKDHVRVIRMPVSESKGVLTAYEQIERHLFRGEKFICSILPGVSFARGWDAHCMDTLQKATAYYKTPLIALTCTSSGDTPSLDSPGSFAGLSDAGSLLSYKIKHLKGQYVQALAWSSVFSFCSASRLKNLPYERYHDDHPNGIDTTVHDMYMTIRLLQTGWILIHPTAALVGMLRNELPGTGSQGWRLTMQAVNRKRAIGKPFHYMGIMAEEGNGKGMLLTARARLGLTPAMDEQEIVLKMGSMGEYLSVLSRLELRKNNG